MFRCPTGYSANDPLFGQSSKPCDGPGAIWSATELHKKLLCFCSRIMLRLQRANIRPNGWGLAAKLGIGAGAGSGRGGGGWGRASETGGRIGPTAPSIPHAGCSSSRQAAYPPLRSDGELRTSVRPTCRKLQHTHGRAQPGRGDQQGAAGKRRLRARNAHQPRSQLRPGGIGPTGADQDKCGGDATACCVNGLGSLVCLEVGLTRWWWHPRRAGSFAKGEGRLAKSPMRLESVTRTKAHAAALIKSATVRSWTHSCWLCRSACLPTSAVLVKGLPCSSIVVGLCICRYSAMLHDGALTRFDECIGSVFASRACTRKATGGDCNFHADATRPQRRAKGQGKIRLAPLFFPQPASALCRRVRRGAQGSPTRLTGPISVASITSAVRDYANGDLVLYRVIGYMADRHVSSEPASPLGPSTWQ